MIHLSIQGPQAVGKTTALRQIEPNLPNVIISYENPHPIVLKRGTQGLDISTESGFIANQRLFIAAEIERYESLVAPCVVFDRGPEDTECYTVNYPAVIGKDWSTEKLLKYELAALRKCTVDRILYIDSTPDRLLSNKRNDAGRRRGSFNLLAFQVYRRWYAMKTNCDFIDTSQHTISEIADEVSHWINCNKIANKAVNWTPLRGASYL